MSASTLALAAIWLTAWIAKALTDPVDDPRGDVAEPHCPSGARPRTANVVGGANDFAPFHETTTSAEAQP